MSGKNINMKSIGVGMKRNDTQYATGAQWHDGNLVRWHNGMLEPIGGWTDFKTAGGNTIPTGVRPIRDIFSWRDYLKSPYVVFGSADNVHVVKIDNDSDDNIYTDITPTDLSWSTEPNSGFGAGFYGAGPYGYTEAQVVNPDLEGQWSFQNWGRTLVAVHNQDGRLFQWDPQVVAPLTPIAGAPVDNTICLVTEEEFLMVMGGRNNPTRVQWCSRRDATDWTPTEVNSAGGFELQTDGSIISAQRVQGGIIVITNTDVHLIEYVGPPNYYGRRLISDYAGGLSKNSLTAIPGGCIWVGPDGFWKYDGNITKLPCDVSHHVFDRMRKDLPSRLFLGNNEAFTEIWFFYPVGSDKEPRNYVVYGYGQEPYWSVGKMDRTAWHAPVHKIRPIAVEDRRPYNHEVGWTAAGASRNVWVETGAIEFNDGDKSMRVDRIYQDLSKVPSNEVQPANAYEITFKLRQSPSATERIKGPIQLNTQKGYTTTRLRARQAVMRIDQKIDAYWTAGKIRLRTKEAGSR